MLQLILGKSGYGKSYEVKNRIKQVLEKTEKKVMLLVPEQYSFETEKELYTLLGAQRFTRVTVTSFSRLSDLVERRYGCFSPERLTDAGKLILMNVAIGEVCGKLQTYGKQIGNPAFTSSMVTVTDELKSCGITPRTLLESVSETQDEQDSILINKLSDVALIFEVYDAYLARGYLDPADTLTVIDRALEGKDFFSEYVVFVDEFVSFTAVQYRILAKILAQSGHLAVALCCDGLQKGDPIFKIAQECAYKLIALANRENVTVSAPVILSTPRRFQSQALIFLEQNIARYRKDRFEGDASAITLAAAANPKQEIMYVAATIRQLAQTQGMRYRDIVVIGRGIEEYLPYIESCFALYDIPYFADRRSEIEACPLVVLLYSILDVVNTGFSADALLRYLKCGLSGFEQEDIALFEDYIFLWNVDKGGFLDRFIKNPRGFAGELTDEDTQVISKLNVFREDVIKPFVRFRQQTAHADGAQITQQLYSFLKDTGVLKRLPDYAALFVGADEALAQEQGRVFELVIGVLEQLYGTLGGVQMNLTRYAGLLKLAIQSSDIASVPHYLDQVTIGDAERIRPNNPRVVFIIGANDGIFPQNGGDSGLFSQREREQMGELGLNLLNTADFISDNERFFVYAAVTCASEKVYLSYPRGDARAKELAPSFVIKQLQKQIAELQVLSVSTLAPEYFALTDAATFALLSAGYGQDGVLKDTLLEYFMGQGKELYQERLQQLDQALVLQGQAINDSQLTHKLYGESFKLSPSRVEKFNLCRFSYFCEYGLKLKPKKRAVLSPIETGVVMHEVLQRMIAKYGGKGLISVKRAQLKKDIEGFIEDYLLSGIGKEAISDKRLSYLISRLNQTLLKLILHMAQEFSQSLFEPVDFELPVNKTRGIPPCELQTATGERVYIEGVIDRVDVMKKGGDTYIRVVDYKTGAKSFQLGDVVYGLNMQMLYYLFSIWEHGGKRYEGKILPAGILYMPARNPIVEMDRQDSVGQIELEQRSVLKMSGLVLEDVTAIEGMEQSGNGIFIPAKLKKDGEIDPRTSVASLAMMGALKRHSEKLLLELAALIRSGNVDILPINNNRYTPCEFCEYKMICKREDCDPYREIVSYSKEEIKQLLKVDEDDE